MTQQLSSVWADMTMISHVSKRAVIFIIHWKISRYTPYFVSLLSKISSAHQVLVVDATGVDVQDLEVSSYCDAYIKYLKSKPIGDLYKKIKRHIKFDPVIFTNSTRDELHLSRLLQEEFKCEHFLYEHLSSLVNADKNLSNETIQNLQKTSIVFIPSMALKKQFLKYKGSDQIRVNYLEPSPCYYEEVKMDLDPKRQFIYIGRVIEEKQIIRFIKKNIKFFEKNEIDFLVIGSGSSQKLLDDLLAQHKWLKHIPQVSPVEAKRHIDQSMAVVVSSPEESYSMLAVEGLLRGKPVLMQRTGIGLELHEKIPALQLLSSELEVSEDHLLKINNFNKAKETAAIMRGLIRSKSDEVLKVLSVT